MLVKSKVNSPKWGSYSVVITNNHLNVGFAQSETDNNPLQFIKI